MSEAQVTLAAVAGAHGIGGEVRLKLFAEGVESLKRHKGFMAGDRPLTLLSVKPGSVGAIARFAEIGDRAAAEALRGTLLTVLRSALPPLEPGEYYHADLIGLPCESQDGRARHCRRRREFRRGRPPRNREARRQARPHPFRPGLAGLGDAR